MFTYSCDMLIQIPWLTREVSSELFICLSHGSVFFIEAYRHACLRLFQQPSAHLRLLSVLCAYARICFRQRVASSFPFTSPGSQEHPPAPGYIEPCIHGDRLEPSGTQYSCVVITFRSNNNFF